MLRTILSNLARKVLAPLSKKLNSPNVIFDHEGTKPYLSRYYLFRGPKSADGSHPFDEFGRPKKNIVRSDGWSWGLSFVLAGGYSEEKLVGSEVIRRKVKPFSINFIRPHEFHRVDLLEKDCWTFFFRGPRLNEWFYKDRLTHEKIQWNQHVKLADK